jgi:hypothetical protein
MQCPTVPFDPKQDALKSSEGTGSQPMKNLRLRQGGGMLSLLLVLLAIGLLAYFALRSHSIRPPAAGPAGAGNQQQVVLCSKLASDLVGRTGGIGADYKAGYEALPPSCRGMLPPPAGVTPDVPESQGQ